MYKLCQQNSGRELANLYMGHFVMYEINFFGNKFGKLAKFTRLQQKKMTSQ